MFDLRVRRASTFEISPRFLVAQVSVKRVIQSLDGSERLGIAGLELFAFLDLEEVLEQWVLLNQHARDDRHDIVFIERDDIHFANWLGVAVQGSEKSPAALHAVCVTRVWDEKRNHFFVAKGFRFFNRTLDSHYPMLSVDRKQFFCAAELENAKGSDKVVGQVCGIESRSTL